MLWLLGWLRLGCVGGCMFLQATCVSMGKVVYGTGVQFAHKPFGNSKWNLLYLMYAYLNFILNLKTSKCIIDNESMNGNFQ